MARGLTTRERADLALAHYALEDSRPGPRPGPEGVVLWSHGPAAIRLMLGNDVLTEGGLSLVLFVEGERVCVLSFSWAPERIALGQGGGLVPLLARKQLTQDHAYQAAFHRLFDRVTPAHLCMGAFEGVVGALGHARAVGISAGLHPARAPGREAHFDAAYDAFWTSIGGRPEARLGFVLDLPQKLTPLDALDRGRRRRAQARRGHVEAVRAAARAVLEGREGHG